MSVAAAPVALHRPLPPEESARADYYALLSRLLQAPPDGALLAALAAAPQLPATANAPFARAWKGLVEASSAMDADAAAEEYEKLFVGIGKAAISLYAGFYAGAGAVEHPRVRIQRDLAELGLARPDTLVEPEDHLGGLLEVMRVLVAGGAGRGPATIAQQRQFFETHLAVAAPKFFVAVGAWPEANYYRHVAAVGLAFVAVESESFELE